MKSFPKFIIIFFLVIFVIQLVCLFFLYLAPAASQAEGITYTAQVQLPGYTYNPNDTSTGNIANYVKAIYKYAIGVVGILAAVVLMVGGVMWIVAGGSATLIGEAKSWIAASLTGLILALCSYLLLATINPDLVNLKTTEISKVESSGCCYSYTDSANTIVKCDSLSKNQCQQNRTWVASDCSQVSYCKIVGCCDGMCSTGAISETECRNQYGGTWLVGTYTCSAVDVGKCVTANTANGCCMFFNTMEGKNLCDNRATETECKSFYENKPGFQYIEFDNLKVCRAGGGLTPAICVSK